MYAFVALAAMQTAPVDPLALNLVDGTQVSIKPGITDLRTGRPSSPNAIAEACKNARFIVLGESHDNRVHKEFFADVINALVKQGRNVSVGMEMFTRPNQGNLAPWSMGWWTKEQFIEEANWKTEWGFDFSIYEPVFNVVKDHKLPLVALNVPRAWVRAVGRGGPGALPEEAKGQIPDLDLTNENHKAVFNALLGGHPMGTPEQMANIYCGQVLWDTGMADTAIKYMDSQPKTPGRIMVIIAGSGHALYKQAINYRITRRTGEPVPTAIAIDGDVPRFVSRGIGDWAFLGGKGESRD